MTARSHTESDEVGRDGAPGPGLRLVVRELDRALAFQRDVLGAEVLRSDGRLAVVRCVGASWAVIADAAVELQALREVAGFVVRRGAGIEIVLVGLDPAAVEARARSAGAGVLSAVRTTSDGAIEAHVVDRDGYVWVARRSG